MPDEAPPAPQSSAPSGAESTTSNPTPSEPSGQQQIENQWSELLNRDEAGEAPTAQTGGAAPVEEAQAEQDAGAEQSGEENAPSAPLDAKQQQLLKRAGLSEGDVKDLPPQAKSALFGKLDKMFSDLGKQFAERGRAVKAEQQRQAAAQRQPAPTSQPAPQTPAVGGVVFKPEVWGEEAAKELNGHVAPVVQQMQAMSQQMQEMRASIKQHEMDALRRNVDGLFEDLAETYPAYGTGSVSKLTQGQMDERTKVLQLADDIYHGVKGDGRDISVEDAIRMAHNSLTAEAQAETKVKEKVRQITDSAKGRNRQITMRPGNRKTVDANMSPEEKAARMWDQQAAELGLAEN